VLVERSAPLYSPADIILGINDCMLLCDIKHITHQKYIDEYMRKITQLRFQFDNIWLLIQNYTDPKDMYDYMIFDMNILTTCIFLVYLVVL
jgi:hypothetical protein